MGVFGVKLNGKRVKSMVGERHGRLVVKEMVAYAKGTNRTCCLVVCDCGNEKFVFPGDLRSGASKSCGCLHKESCSKNGKLRKTHGLSAMNRLLYHVWRQMIQRCENPSHKDYPGWGGRGITVCEDWHDVLKFEAWAMSSGYRPKVTIERVDNMGNYCPENCTWIPNEMQGKNTRNIRWINYRGKDMPLTEFAEESGLKYRTVITRLEAGYTPEQVVSTPLRRSRRWHA